MKLVIIRYNAGNIRSVAFALERIGITPSISSDLDTIISADKIIFPGVGEAGSAMKFLKEHKLDILIPGLKQPVLGICLGMQLLCNHSEEGNTACMKVFDTEVTRLGDGLKVPHVGWNQIESNSTAITSEHDGKHFYFVHSYAAGICEQTVARTTYGRQFSSALQNNNFYGVQFHPEKSAGAGEQILQRFIELS